MATRLDFDAPALSPPLMMQVLLTVGSERQSVGAERPGLAHSFHSFPSLNAASNQELLLPGNSHLSEFSPSQDQVEKLLCLGLAQGAGVIPWGYSTALTLNTASTEHSQLPPVHLSFKICGLCLPVLPVFLLGQWWVGQLHSACSRVPYGGLSLCLQGERVPTVSSFWDLPSYSQGMELPTVKLLRVTAMGTSRAQLHLQLLRSRSQPCGLGRGRSQSIPCELGAVGCFSREPS